MRARSAVADFSLLYGFKLKTTFPGNRAGARRRRRRSRNSTKTSLFIFQTRIKFLIAAPRKHGGGQLIKSVTYFYSKFALRAAFVRPTIKPARTFPGNILFRRPRARLPTLETVYYYYYYFNFNDRFSLAASGGAEK